MQNAVVTNPNDFKVVTFHNSEEFGFTPEMGCMYDSRAIHGRNGLPGIEAGEKIVLPYHIGQQLATNLAKRVFNTSQPATVDQKGVSTGVPIWNELKLKEKAQTYITEMYTEEKPVMQSETDKLMAKVEEYRKMIEPLLGKSLEANVIGTPNSMGIDSLAPAVFQDKQEVIAELEKRDIKHDKRKSKAELEKLLI